MNYQHVNKNNLLELSCKVRRLIMGRNILLSLHALGTEEWDRSFNSLSNEHLIKNIANTNTKTEAVRSYVGKVVKLYMNSLGVNAGAWSKDSIAADHTSGMIHSNKLATSVYKSHDALFKDTVSRLLGFDPDVVAFSISKGNEAAFYLVKHLVCVLDLASFESRNLLDEATGDLAAETYTDKFNASIIKDFAFEIEFFEKLLESEKVDDTFFLAINTAILANDTLPTEFVEPDLLGVLIEELSKNI